MSLSEMFHVGIVVPDLNEARAHFTALLGVEWGPIIRAEQVEMRLDDERDVVLPSRICYTTAPPHIELIQELPGSTWVCNEHSNLHHIGFFSEALKADSAGLTRAQCPLELSGRQGGDAPSAFVYHRDPLGVRIEFVDAAQRSMMEEVLFKPQDVEELVFNPETHA